MTRYFPAPPLLALTLFAATVHAAPVEKQRLFVLTDIEADPDDTQSLVRLLLYANEIDIEGIVATTSTHMKNEVHPESVRALLRRYGQVATNLRRHDGAYPPVARLLAVVGQGLPAYGSAGVGDGKDSQGSAMLVKALRSSDPRPLWVSAWGGTNTLAQALYRLERTASPAEFARALAKLRVYAISDQDDTGAWIRRTWPSLFYIVSPGGYGNATWMGMNQAVEGLDNTTVGNAWIARHIQQGHGPLGAAYPDVAYGMEGDTPAFLGLVPNGLNVPERPDWGGWGGRYELRVPPLGETDPAGFNGGVPVAQETRPIWTNASDTVTPTVAGEYGRAVKPGPRTYGGPQATVWRWRDDVQNDFAARMAWSTQPYARANHAPVVTLAHPDRLAVHAGDAITLDARPSTDPDGDSLGYRWFLYPEAGTCKLPVQFWAENLARVVVQAPQVTEAGTLHFIVRVGDKGSPALARYRRVIVTVLPRP